METDAERAHGRADGARAEFTPAELDVLEDALAGLPGGLAGGLESWEPSPAVSVEPDGTTMNAATTARLAEYRELLELFAAHTPIEDPPAHLFTAILEQATAERTETHTLAPREPAHGQKDAGAEATGGLWNRLWRALALPGLALAGTAAAVLALVRPAAPLDEAPADDHALPSAAEAPAAEASATVVIASQGREDASVGNDGLQAEVAPTGDAQPALALESRAALAEERSEPAAADEDGAATPPLPRAKKKRSRNQKKDRPEPRPAAKPMPSAKAPAPEAKAGSGYGLGNTASKSELRDTLAAADRLRRSGECTSADAQYTTLVHVGGLEGARALAGQGLCAEQRGRNADAEHLFARARSAYPKIDGWIAAERERAAGVRN